MSGGILVCSLAKAGVCAGSACALWGSASADGQATCPKFERVKAKLEAAAAGEEGHDA